MHQKKLTPKEKAFVAAFEDATLPAACFHHRDHVRLAWLYLQLYDLPAALGRYSEGLKRFAHAQGQDGLYHETITFAFLFLINERMARHEHPSTWDAFATHNDDVLTGGKALLRKYYQADTLNSALARAIFVMPDRKG